MKFPNAFKGIKKVWLAELLLLCAAVLGIAIVCVIAANGTLVGEDKIEVTDSVKAVVGGLGIATALIALVAFVLNLVGLISARKDEESFKIALMVTLLGIAVSVISAIWSNNTELVRWMDLATTLCSLFASYYVLTGIANLAEKFPDADTKAIALKSRTMLEISFCATALFKCIISVFNIQEGSTANTILGIVALLVEIVSYVLYLRALSRGKKMLAA